MKIVKVVTNKRVLYGILVRKSGWFLNNKFQSLISRRCQWSREKDILDFCLNPNLEYVEMRLKILCAPNERIKRIVQRKCKCHGNID